MNTIEQMNEKVSVHIKIPVIKQLRKISQVSGPKTEQQQNSDEIIRKVESDYKGAVQTKNDVKEYAKLDNSLKSLNKQIENTKKKIDGLGSPHSAKWKWDKGILDANLAKLEAQKSSVAKEHETVGKRLEARGVNVKNIPKAVEKAEQKVKQSKHGYDTEKATQRSEKHKARVERANNNLSIAGNLNKARSDIVNFITGVVGAAASVHGEGSKAAEVLAKWKTATGQLTLSLSSFLVPALEALTGFVTAAVHTINSFVETFPNLSQWIGYAIGALVALMAIIVPIITLTGTMSAALAGVSTAIAFFGKVIGVIGAIIKPLFVFLAGLSAPMLLLVAAIAGIAIGLYAFNDDVKAFVDGIIDSIGNFFSGLWDKAKSLIPGFGDDEKEQAKKVNDYKDKVKNKTNPIENTVANSSAVSQIQANASFANASEIMQIQSKASGPVSIKAATCILALSGSSIALATDNPISGEGIQPELPKGLENANQYLANNTLVTDNGNETNSTNLTDALGQTTQVSSANRLAISNGNSVNVEGSNIVVNISAGVEANSEDIALAVRQALAEQQAEQERQIRGMLND